MDMAEDKSNRLDSGSPMPADNDRPEVYREERDCKEEVKEVLG